MQKILAIVGFIAITVLGIYFGIYTPINAYNELRSKNQWLTKELEKSRYETTLVYEKFDQALKTHLNQSDIQAIYGDPEYFTYSDNKISITTEDSSETTLTYSYPMTSNYVKKTY